MDALFRLVGHVFLAMLVLLELRRLPRPQSVILELGFIMTTSMDMAVLLRSEFWAAGGLR